MTIPHQHTDQTDSTFTCCTTAMPWPTKTEDRTCPECGTVWEREPVDIGAGARIKAARAACPVTFDLMAADDTYFVLTEALREFASRQRWEAEDDPTGNAESRVRWAECTEGLLDRIEQAMSQVPHPEPTGTVGVPREDLRQVLTLAARDPASWVPAERQAYNRVFDVTESGEAPTGDAEAGAAATGSATVQREDLRLAVSALRDLAEHGAEPLADFAGRLAVAAGLAANERVAWAR